MQVIHHVEHSGHRYRVRPFAEIFLDTDQADAKLLELHFDHRGVEAIAERA
nr:hypothetical protein [Nocardia bovistercoris]